MQYIRYFSVHLHRFSQIVKSRLLTKTRIVMKMIEVVSEDYSINGFKHLSELAMEYFPELSGPSAASKKMRACIKANVALNEQMSLTGFTDKTIDISPKMQITLYNHWGPPRISVPLDDRRTDENDNKNQK